MYRAVSTTRTLSRADAVAVALFDKSPRLPETYEAIDRMCGATLSAAVRRPDFSASAGSVTALHGSRGPRLFVLGLGTSREFHANHLRAAGSRLTPMLYAARASSLRIHLGPLENDRVNAARAVGEGLGLGGFIFSQFKGTAAEKEDQVARGPRELSVAVEGAAALDALNDGLALAESVNIARDLAATPPNVAHPAYLVARCRTLARQAGLEFAVIDARRARALGMGGLLAVGGAGSTPPAVIVLEWNPPQVRRRASPGAPILLVGKAITFDTGGYSIKPTDSMVSMKYDKSGGMVVVGAMHAMARLGVPRRVVALIPVAENMIGQTAYRPSDILTLCNGVTVEVNNTDAEGRLVLADALAYGCRKYRPSLVIDVATLTGGIVVALGPWCAGLYCNDEQLYQQLIAASEATGERLWRMPLWPEHRKHIKATHADIANAAGREASPCTAAAFLSHFVSRGGPSRRNGHIPWAHLDIAGVSDVSRERDPTGIYPKGPTGFGVRLLVQMLASGPQ
jgi:leucyl aminopeptidase